MAVKFLVQVTILCTISSVGYSQSSWSQLELERAAADAVALVHTGEYAAAQTAFEEAILNAQWDEGKTYSTRLVVPGKLDPERISYGQEQLNRMLNDRSYMDKFNIRDSRIAEFCVRRFAGFECGNLVRWDKSAPDLSFSEITFIRDESIIELRLKDYGTRNVSHSEFEKSWSRLVFELINATNWVAAGHLNDAASGREIPRDSYVRQVFRLEIGSTHMCRSFYVREFLPWAENTGFKSDPTNWYTATKWWGLPQYTLDFHKDRDRFPWSTYGEQFDRLSRQ